MKRVIVRELKMSPSINESFGISEDRAFLLTSGLDRSIAEAGSVTAGIQKFTTNFEVDATELAFACWLVSAANVKAIQKIESLVGNPLMELLKSMHDPKRTQAPVNKDTDFPVGAPPSQDPDRPWFR